MMSGEFTEVEITVKFLTDDHQDVRTVYLQRVNYDWMVNQRPTLVQKIIANVNDLEFRLPEYKSAFPPGSYQEVK